MMKKNLFLLFSFYFFVIQAVFLGLLRGDVNFYWLALINCIFLILIASFSKEKKEVKIKMKNENSYVESQVVKVDGDKYIKTEKSHHTDLKYEEKQEEKKEKKIKKVKKKRVYKPIHHIWFFIITILFGFFVWFWLGEIVLYLHLLISVAASFILFVIFGLLFSFKGFKVWEAKLYMISLIGLLIWSAIMFFHISFDFLSFDGKDNTINNEQLDNSTGVENIFVSVDDDIEGSTGDIQTVEEQEDINLEEKATFEDVIKFILEKNNVTLNDTKNIKFTYIPYNAQDYAYYRTAYDKKLIGKSIKPNNNLLCETYVVMNGLVEGRPVSSYGDIKTLYWNYASKNEKLPTCEYGKYVILGDLMS